jgi:hypothetical protein
MIAAISHDVDHPGTDNDFEQLTDSDLALMHNDISVLENHHATVCFTTAQASDGVNIFRFFEPTVYRDIRRIIINAILSTDMKLHFSMVSEIEKKNILNSKGNKIAIVNLLLHAADVGNLLSPVDESLLWTEKVMNEFKTLANRYIEHSLPVPGHISDLSTLPKQAKLQVDFIDYIVSPLWQHLFNKSPTELKQLQEYLANTRSEFVSLSYDSGKKRKSG